MEEWKDKNNPMAKGNEYEEILLRAVAVIE